jgi:DNA-binding NtrC family response regulator
LCAGDVIHLEHLPAEKLQGPVVPLRGAPGFVADGATYTGHGPSSAKVVAAAGASEAQKGAPLAPRRATEPPIAADEDERRRIIVALEKCAGNQTKAAQLLGISRRTLVTRLKEYALPRPRKPT